MVSEISYFTTGNYFLLQPRIMVTWLVVIIAGVKLIKKCFASTELGGREAAIIEYQLIDVDTNVMEGYEIVTFEKSTPPYLTDVSSTEYFEVPTGTYQGKTIHSWLAYDSMGHPNWYGTNSKTNVLSIIN